MNFNQWKNYADKKDVSRITYVCGDQFALVELVVDDIKNILQVPDTDLINVDADPRVWQLASQYSLDPNANRLIVVRSAEKIADWEDLSGWLAQSRANPKNYIVFVSYASDGPGIYDKGKKVSYQEHIELIRTKGKFIKCSLPNEDDLCKWIMSYGLAYNAANFLVERTSGDTASIFNVLRKVHLWNGSPNTKAIALLCEENESDSFVDCLILRNRKSAYLALQNLSVEDYSKVIGNLDYRLDTVSTISRCVRRRMYDGDIAASTGIKVFLVKKFKGVAKDYDDKKIKYCRQLLALADSALKDGATTGVMESLITLW